MKPLLVERMNPMLSNLVEKKLIRRQRVKRDDKPIYKRLEFIANKY